MPTAGRALLSLTEFGLVEPSFLPMLLSLQTHLQNLGHLFSERTFYVKEYRILDQICESLLTFVRKVQVCLETK